MNKASQEQFRHNELFWLISWRRRTLPWFPRCFGCRYNCIFVHGITKNTWSSQRRWRECCFNWLQLASNFAHRLPIAWTEAGEQNVDENTCLAFEYCVVKRRRVKLIIVPKYGDTLVSSPGMFSSFFFLWFEANPISNVCAKLQGPACPRSRAIDCFARCYPYWPVVVFGIFSISQVEYFTWLSWHAFVSVLRCSKSAWWQPIKLVVVRYPIYSPARSLSDETSTCVSVATCMCISTGMFTYR